MNKYENYREIGLPWLKEIPKYWNKKKLKKISHFKTGNSIKDEIKNKYNKKDNSYLFITTSDIDGEKLIINHQSSIFIPKSEKCFRIAEVGSTLLCIEGGSGGKKVAFTSQLVCYGNKLCSIKLDLGVDKYLYYVLISDVFKIYYTMNISGDRNGISQKNVGEFILPFPDITEQKKIAKYLDWKIGEIDKLIDIEKQKIVELNELELNIIWNYIFNGEKHSEYKKVKSDYINEIPKNWHFMKIKRLFRIKKNIAGELGYNVLSITQQGIKVKDIRKNEGQMSSDYSKYQIVKIGDFAMNHMDLLTGYIDISNFNGVTSPDYRVFQKISHNVHSKYFLFMFQLFYKLKIFYKYGKGAANEGRWRLPAIEFLNFEVPLPDIDEQKEIVQIIENKQNTVRIKLEEVNQKIVKLTSLKYSLISEVITGQIDVRNVKIPERK